MPLIKQLDFAQEILQYQKSVGLISCDQERRFVCDSTSATKQSSKASLGSSNRPKLEDITSEKRRSKTLQFALGKQSRQNCTALLSARKSNENFKEEQTKRKEKKVEMRRGIECCTKSYTITSNDDGSCYSVTEKSVWTLDDFKRTRCYFAASNLEEFTGLTWTIAPEGRGRRVYPVYISFTGMCRSD